MFFIEFSNIFRKEKKEKRFKENFLFERGKSGTWKEFSLTFQLGEESPEKIVENFLSMSFPA